MGMSRLAQGLLTSTKHLHQNIRHVLKFLPQMKHLTHNGTILHTDAVLTKQVAFSACYRLYGPGIESQSGQDFPNSSRPALGLT
jgi:hypothetical protein